MLKINPSFEKKTPRSTVEIQLPGGEVINGPRGASVGEFLALLQSPLLSQKLAHDYSESELENQPPPIVGAIVNGELRELTFPIILDAVVKPITMGDADGMRIYRRSLTFLLETAFEDLFPEGILYVDHSVASGGYYCQVTGRAPLTLDELNKLESHMASMVEDDLPFARKEVPLSEAINYFEQHGAHDKVRLLAHRQKNYLTLYQLKSYRDYHHGYMVPSTGYLRWFNLLPTGEGFTLRFPRRHAPLELLPMPEYPKLLNTFRQYGNWLNRLGISNVGALNDAIQKNRSSEVILVSEALHEQQVSQIANMIAERADRVKVVLIAGPSSSGKTTFSKRLAIQLLVRGISPFPLELDNYFIDRELTPRDEKGEYDFENILALDRDRLSKDLRLLTTGQEVQLPRYDFLTGKSEPGDIIQLRDGEVVIIEGIHGLNPELLPSMPADQSFKVYASALTQLNLDRHNRVSTTDTRLLRRIVRDHRERGYSPQITISRWESVRRGEKRYIFPYQENADIMFNSALAYELSALKPLAEPLLRQVQHGKPEHVEAKRLLAFLEWFLPLDSNLIPDNSILREFLGGSILSGFKLWHNHD